MFIDYEVNKSVEKYFSAFSNGFHRVCGGRVLVSMEIVYIYMNLFASYSCFYPSMSLLSQKEFFHPQELMEMVVGIQEYDFKELKMVCSFKGI